MQQTNALAQEKTDSQALAQASRAEAVPIGRIFEGYAGNQAALRQLSRTVPAMQRKVAVGAFDDPLEAEADRAADRVMGMRAPNARRPSDSATDSPATQAQGEDGLSLAASEPVLRRDPTPAPVGAPGAQGAAAPGANGEEFSATIPYELWLRMMLQAMPAPPKLQMPELQLPGVYTPPSPTANILQPAQPFTPLASTSTSTQSPQSSPLPPSGGIPPYGPQPSPILNSTAGSGPAPAPLPTMPTGLPFPWSFRPFSFIATLSGPSLDADLTKDMPPSASAAAFQYNDLVVASLTGQPPPLSQTDWTKALPIGFAIFAQNVPGFSEWATKTFASKQKGCKETIQVNFFATKDPKGGGAFLKFSPCPKVPTTPYTPAEAHFKVAPNAPSAMPEAPADVHGVLSSSGEPLGAATREFFEPRFGADLSQVRIHSDSRAVESARGVNALAYAVGHHIVLGPGADKGPGSLMAHELAHTLQQSPATLHRSPGPGSDDYMQGYQDAMQGLPALPGPRNDDATVDYNEGYAKGKYELSMSSQTPTPAPAAPAPAPAPALAAKEQSAWDKVKSAAGSVADFGKGVYGQMKEDAVYVKKAEEAVNSGIDWAEDKAKAGTGWVADQAKGIPVVEQIAGAAKSGVDAYVGFEGGVLKGATGLVGGVAGMAANPVDTAIGLEGLAEHARLAPGMANPLQVAHAVYNVAVNGANLASEANRTLNPAEIMKGDLTMAKNLGLGIAKPYIESYKKGNYAEMAGRGAFDVALLLTGVGEAEGASAVGKTGQVLNAGSKAEVLSAASKAKVLEGAAEGSKVADLSKAAEGADAARVSEGADAAKAAATPVEPVQVPVHPGAEPLAPTQPVPGPTELPPAPAQSPLLPDGTWDPAIPKSPKVPQIDVPESVPPQSVPPEPVQVPVHPGAEPTAPTQHPPGPTEVPPEPVAPQSVPPEPVPNKSVAPEPAPNQSVPPENQVSKPPEGDAVKAAEPSSDGAKSSPQVEPAQQAARTPTREQVLAEGKQASARETVASLKQQKAELQAELRSGPKTPEGRPDTERIAEIREELSELIDEKAVDRAGREYVKREGQISKAETAEREAAKVAERARMDPKDAMRKAFDGSDERAEVIKGVAEDQVGKLLTAPQKLTVDHIVSIKQISEMPGFEKLTMEEMEQLATLKDNLIVMDGSANFSKGARAWSNWKQAGNFYDAETLAKMVAREGTLRQQIQSWITKAVKGR